jgi:hypothetical protein
MVLRWAIGWFVRSINAVKVPVTHRAFRETLTEIT